LAERNGDLAESKRYLEELLKIEPENTLGLMRKGRVIFKMASGVSEENDAYQVFQQVYRTSPENTAFPDVNMGLLYEQAGKPDNANKMMERAIQKDGDNIRTRLSIAKWGLDTNRLNVAKENAEAALKLDPTSLEAKLYAGLVARFNNDLGTAEQMFRDAHQQSPTNLAALTQLCLALVDQPDEAKKQKAMEYAKMNVQMHADLNQVAGREAAVTYAWVLSRLGRSADAMNAIQQILPAVTTLSADSAYHAAKILYDSGQNEAARKILELKLAGDAVFPNRNDAEQLLSRIRSNP
jgi:tetratricopeptide (TPR) repeat protein